MLASRKEAIQRTEHLLATLADLRRATRSTETSIRRALREVEAGAELASALSIASPSVTRRTMNDALEAVERARHEVRIVIFAAGLDQGMSIGDLGRAFGFSRQMAARYAKEARTN